MNTRYICPHCHASLNPHSMERAFSDVAEYRICPACDEAVFFSLLDAPRIPEWLQRETADAARGAEQRAGASRGDADKAECR